MPSAVTAQYGDDQRVADTGGRVLAGNAVERPPSGGVNGVPTERAHRAARGLRARLARRRQLFLDVGAVAVAAFDVWFWFAPDAESYNYVLSIIAVAALVLRRRWPFLVVLLTVPGFLAGMAQLAAMIALGTLARQKLLATQTCIAAGLVWLSRFFLWPPQDFFELSWTTHVHDAIYGCIVAGMPIAIGLLAHAREELSARIAELAASRERERLLHAHAVRADERARLAREMHDVVSHQVSLIAMQAGALRVGVADPDAQRVAGTIRSLSTRTLDELRQLVSVLRTTGGDDSPQPRVEELPQLVAGAGIPASLSVQGPVHDLPAPISGAVYRTVQEALTNVRKHAGCAPTAVRVHADAAELRVEIRNDAPVDPRECPSLPSGGHGLVGLRERAALLNGTFEAGPSAEGGFRVAVTFPLARTLDRSGDGA
ncbi:sensor histidine kinase [Saccharothrix algeriensis]|uniref:histidine kinase n=1 Tax=Saccharothrix algeriensis TaxID=173560 RepID=A0A8T8HW97_9PSEU|nr:histidine kinase [Saccharothrix algeriensis]MBM7814074.1 signal transduction histidine kinase [Saccharothrix algeriensis]QTR02470.1 sensor histidine kinase [Saccharothrix algeriensis]